MQKDENKCYYCDSYAVEAIAGRPVCNAHALLPRKNLGVKNDQEKPDLTLLDREALEETAKVLMFGAKKYSRDNWRNGISKERLLAAALRHIHASNSGEIKDSESGLSHLAHGLCCLMFALHFEVKGEKNDDNQDIRKNT